jgi:hypothetical protein
VLSGSQPDVQNPLHTDTIVSEHASTRTRTRNSSLEARNDFRFTIRGDKRKGRDSNPDLR